MTLHLNYIMKIIFDLDGTLTDFNKFIQENAIDYFEKKHHMNVQNPDALEIEDIFSIQKSLEASGYTPEDALAQQKHILNQFWVSHRFIKFSLFGRFRPGARRFIDSLRKDGFHIEIHTSRSRTCERCMPGIIARGFTVLQFRLNGVFLKRRQFFFYPDDTAKLGGVIKAQPLLVFDDKPWMIERLSEAGLKTICVAGRHSSAVLPTENVESIHSFHEDELEQKLAKLFGRSNWECHKKETASAKFFRRLTGFKPIIEKLFHPIILHPENRISENSKGVIFAPNHRRTLDPLLIECILLENIHWAALLRFFRAEDSLFNNSKNPVLCRMTKYIFQRLEYFPIDRKRDNPQANNMASIKNMCLFLKNGYKIGIFAEGTTRRPAGQDFGCFDDSFLRLAQKTEAWIQPITIFWPEPSGKGCGVVLNFGRPFQLKGMGIEEAMQHYLEIQRNALMENKEAAGLVYTRQLKNNRR